MTPLVVEDDGPQRFALVVGVDRYDHADAPDFADLRYAERDAVAVAEVLAASGGFKPTILLGVDREGFRAGLADFLGYVESTDHVLVYVASHGVRSADTEWLLLRDGDPERPAESGISVGELRDALAERAPNGTRVGIFDTCSTEAAASAELAGRGAVAGSTQLGLVRGRNELYMRAASPGQVALESSLSGHGLFTDHLLSALRGAADRNGDRVVTA